MNDNIMKLRKNIFYRATIFIEDIGYFAPFGAKLLDNSIKDVMAYEDFEHSIEGEKLINMLKANMEKELKNGKIMGAAIANDVVVNPRNADGIFERRDALCLKISEDGENWTEEYFPYMIIENQCVWK